MRMDVLSSKVRVVAVITNKDPYEMQFKLYGNTLDTFIDEMLKSNHLSNVTTKLMIAEENPVTNAEFQNSYRYGT